MADDQSVNCDYVIRAQQLCIGLNKIMMLINSSHDIEGIFKEVVNETCKALGCESARIAMREHGNWVIRHVNNLPEELIGRSFSDEELPHAALAMITKKPVAIDNAFQDARTNTEMMITLGIKSLIILPLLLKDEVIGVLSFGYHSKAVVFTDNEIDYAEKVSTGIAIALRNVQMYQEMEEAKKLGDALNEIDTILYSAQDYDSIMKDILKLATEAIGAETALIFSREEDKWIIRYVYRLSQSLIGRSFTNTEVLHTAVTAETQRSMAVADALNSPDVDTGFVKMLGIRSLLDFPLIIKEDVVGDLTFHHHSHVVNFNERQVEFVRKLQNSIALAFENAHLRDAAKLSESRLKEAEKLGKFGYFNYDNTSGKITWSEGLFQLFGRDPALGEPTIEEFFELYSVDPGRQDMKKLFGSAETCELDARVKYDENVSHLHIKMQAKKDDTGHIFARFGTVLDITERKQAEESLRYSEERFRALFRDNPTMIVTIDAEFNMLSVNPFCASQLGYTIEELEGQSVLNIFHEDDRLAVAEQFRVCLQHPNQVRSWKYRKICKGGSIVWVEEIAQAIYNLLGQLNILVVCQDITERMRAEQQAVESERFVQTIVDSLPAHIAVLDQQGIILAVNRPWLRFAELNGLPDINSVSAGADYLAVCRQASEESDPLAREALDGIEAVLADRLDGFTMDYPCHSPKQQRWFMMKVIRLNQMIRGVLITHLDVTDRMKAESALQEANNELEAFNYSVAHDLRQPLNTVSGYCQMIGELCGVQLDKECMEYLQKTYSSTLTMNRLIEALLNFSRMARVEPHRERVDLSTMAKVVAEELKLAEPERRITFRIAEGVTAEGDASLLRLVLDNLLGNACKYTAAREEAIIEFGTTESDGPKYYFVRDNGAGFDMADAHELFVPFRRLTATEKFGGFGIGLATVERIIRRHGGRIWAEGEPGKGAVFYFTTC